jgi:hypothetical protein
MTRRVKTVTSEPTETKRQRRTPEQIVADLQAKIDAVNARAAAKEAKANPEAKAVLVAAKALDKAIATCTGGCKKALEDARGILAVELAAMGIRPPQPRRARQEAA